MEKIKHLTLREQRALNLLFHPELYPGMPKRESSKIKIFLWENNSLGEYTTWTIFDDEGRNFIRKVRWEQRAMYRLENPETYCSETVITQEVVDKIISSFLKIKIEMRDENVKYNLCIDGVKRGVIFQGYEVEWDSSSAQEVNAIGNWYNEVMTVFASIR
jgi:hypothetical protein